MKKERLERIIEIAKKAEGMGLLGFSRLTLIMDLKLADEKFDLDLHELINADDMNFSHDIVEIQNNVDRENKEFENYFLPRFASPKLG